MDLLSKKGYNLPLQNNPSHKLGVLDTPKKIKLHPNNFPGIKPKLLVSKGDNIKKGQPIYFDKKNPEVMYTSFLPGIIDNIVYGQKRVIESIDIAVDSTIGSILYNKYKINEIKNLNKEKIKEILCTSGTWQFIRKKPYSKIPDPGKMPNSIFITTSSTEPYAPSLKVLLENINVEYLQAGISALSHFVDGSINMVCPQKFTSNKLQSLFGIDFHTFSGPHPSGNVGYHISNIAPIKDKDHIVWYISLYDISIIGELLLAGCLNDSKIIAVGGMSEGERNKHYLISRGMLINDIVSLDNNRHQNRVISGSVLSGAIISQDESLGFYDDIISVLDNRHDRQFIGWLSPGISKFSLSRTFLSKLFKTKTNPFSTAMNGGVRSIVPIGLVEKMCNLDIMPTMLIKSIIARDIEMMEELGIYECSPEDFGLCSFIDASKMDIMGIIQEGLDYVELEG